GLKKQGVVNPQLPLMNMYEELLHINEGKHLPPQKIAYDSQWQLIDMENTPTPHQRVRHPDGRMRMYIVWRDQQKTRANYINYFHDGRKIQRDKFNRFGQLMVSQHLGAKEEVLKEDCFTPDGRRVLSRHFGGEPRRLRLIQWLDEATQQYHTFEDEEALAAVWLEQYFAEAMPRVFFIDRHRSWAVPLHQLNKNKKHVLISVVHSIHIEATYEDFERGRLNSNYRDVLEERVAVDHCIVLTPQQKQDMEKRFGQATYEIQYIPHTQILPDKKIVFKERDPNLIVAVVRLAAEKQIEDMLKIMQHLLQHHPEKRLEVYGSGPQRAVLNELIYDWGLKDSVLLKGYSKDVGSVFSRAVVSLLTSKVEGAPLSIQESLAHGCPVLAYDIAYGPASLLQHEQCGWLVEPGHVEQAASILADWFDQPQLMQQFSDHAYERARAFCPEIIAEQWRDLLLRL